MFNVNKYKVWKENNIFKFEAKNFFKGQNWGQANFWIQAKICLGPTFEPKLRPGQLCVQANRMRPDQVL